MPRTLPVAATLLAAGCAAVPAARAPRLVVRAPDLTHPLSETYPAATRPDDAIKAGVLDRINADRREAGLSPVAWDEAAARVADAFCAAQLVEGTHGHFLTDGMPPYARTALAGIFGMGSENAVSWRTTGPTFSETPLGLALAGHADMMAETPPDDGHRRTILDPHATHVGVGYAMGQGSFRMAQEFLTRRLGELTLERVAGTPDSVLVKGRMLSPWRLQFVTLAREPLPRPLTRSETSSRRNYTYPEPRMAFVPEGRRSMRVIGTETDDRVRIGSSGEFSFRFTPVQSGIWTLVFYAAEGRERARPGGLAVLRVEPAAP